jgi:hypothetical protein
MRCSRRGGEGILQSGARFILKGALLVLMQAVIGSEVQRSLEVDAQSLYAMQASVNCP